MVVLSVLCAGAVWAAQFAPVPQTGQTLCYDSDGILIDPCDGTGQDGEFQKGVDFPTPRFTDKRDGTIKDNLTGLIWLKNADCIGTEHPLFDNDGLAEDGMVNWQHALDFVAGINNGTYNCGDTSGKGGNYRTDWRLPNIRELLSLLDYGHFEPAIPSPHPFQNFRIAFYWSSTTGANRSEAWRVSFSNGFTTSSPKKFHDNTFDSFVIAVRGGS